MCVSYAALVPEWTFTFSFPNTSLFSWSLFFFLSSQFSPEHQYSFVFFLGYIYISILSVCLFLLFPFCFLSLFSHPSVICSSGEFVNFQSSVCSGQDLWMLAHSTLFFAKYFKYSFLSIDFYGDTQLVLSLGPAFLLSNRATIYQLAQCFCDS